MSSMPRRARRSPPAQALAELDASLRSDLESGSFFFDSYETCEAMQEAWGAVGDELTTEFIAERPGERPFAWWLLTHGQERPINPGSGAEPEFIERLRSGSRFKFLHSRIWLGTLTPIQQDETEYLQEHGLLTADELSRIPLEEPEDETVSMGLRISRRMCRGPRLKRSEDQDGGGSRVSGTRA